MTTPMDDGGPAFPYSIHMEGYDRLAFPGMSLRDWFAGQALAGLMAGAFGKIPSEQQLATAAYQAADAMLTKRKEATP